ncbi:unnamed protein product [Moneuplotes crassus]|uniref:Sulfite exporter TauE/SafE family protein n=1 Tax=Euplotes crassus TaxID=5936 RepID=A0AAD1X609_EUPCR|nr:unnamed protein product [Moneuplotes crassus]
MLFIKQISGLALLCGLILVAYALHDKIQGRWSPDSDICSTDLDCSSKFTSCRSGFCEHKGIFPLSLAEFFSAFIVLLTISLGNSVGIGGGAIITVTGYTLLDLTVTEAVAVANLTIFCAMFSGYLMNFYKKHPLKNATLVDYGIVQCQMPVIGVGTFVGSQLNTVLPDIVVLLFLMALLVCIAAAAILKCIDLLRKENSLLNLTEQVRPLNGRHGHINSASSNIDEVSSERIKLLEEDSPKEKLFSSGNRLFHPVNSSTRAPQDSDLLVSSQRQNLDKVGDESNSGLDPLKTFGAQKAEYTSEEISPTLEKIFYGERHHFTIDKIILVGVPNLLVTIIRIFRGSSTFQNLIGLSKCSAVDWVFFCLELSTLVAFSFINIILLRKSYQEKKQSGYKFVKGDVEWNDRSVAAFGGLAGVGGFVAQTVGLSTEVLFTPSYIRMGVMPPVAGVTSQFLGMWATMTGSILFAIMGYMHFEIGLWLGLFSTIGTIFGSEAIGGYVGRKGRLSIALGIISFLVIASIVAEGSAGIVKAINKRNDGENIWAFGNYC